MVNNRIDIELIKEVSKQCEMWELNNPRVIAMLDNIFKCIEDEQNLTEESKETFTNIVFSNLRIYSRYKVIIRTWNTPDPHQTHIL